MHILIVNFHLEGMTEAEYYRVCDQVAPAFAEVPGLLTKVWLSDSGRNTYGGVYTFGDRQSYEGFLGSELFATVANMPGLAGITATDFGVIEGPTRVTRGALATTSA